MAVEKKNYDYTARERAAKQREQLAEAGGARIEVLLDADDVARLDALVDSGKATSRSGALRYAVRQTTKNKR